MIPGELLPAARPILLPARRVVRTDVRNTSQWPVVVTSHFHFFEANRHLRFDRGTAFGMHLDLLAGGAVRWAPGQLRSVTLTGYAGERGIYGFNGFVNDCLLDEARLPQLRADAVVRLRAAGYQDGPP